MTADVVDVDGLTGRWLGAVFERDVILRSCKRIGTGQTAATYRLTLDAPGLPTSVVAKVATGDEAARERVRAGFRSEVGFYTHLQSIVDVHAPRCWYAAVSDDALQFTLLLEDLAPRVPGVQADGCTAAQAEAAIRNLAGLHAPTWNDAALLGHEFLRRPTPESAAFLGEMATSSTRTFLDVYGAALAAEDAETLTAAADAIETWVMIRSETFALLHGDYRLDNLMFTRDASEVVAVDWQTLMVGLPARDLAYFLGTGLPADERRHLEARLVAAYHEGLVARGVVDYDLDRCFEDYRVGQLQGPMITTIGAAVATAQRTSQADAMFLAMAQRSCAAIRELDSLDLVRRLS